MKRRNFLGMAIAVIAAPADYLFTKMPPRVEPWSEPRSWNWLLKPKGRARKEYEALRKEVSGTLRDPMLRYGQG